jgi:hypothetical protein
LLLLALPGCGAGTASVNGKVTFRGKPLTTGTVYLAAPDGVQVPGPIAADGTYHIDAIPAGTAKIGVVSFKPEPALFLPTKQAPRPARPPAANTAGWFEIPETYADPLKSGLSVKLKSGSNEHDIQLP